jgi:hypothetical protein
MIQQYMMMKLCMMMYQPMLSSFSESKTDIGWAETSNLRWFIFSKVGEMAF